MAFRAASARATSPRSARPGVRRPHRGQLLAELDAPLVERIDVPDDALHKDLVLVHGDQRAEVVRRHLGVEDRVGRAVALKDLVRQQLRDALRRRPWQWARAQGGGGGSSGSPVSSTRRPPTAAAQAAAAPAASSSLRTSASDLPRMSASVWAKKLESRIRWCLPSAKGVTGFTAARKSAGISLVPWWISW